MDISVYIGTSLDGYIAREDGDIAWLDSATETPPPGEDCGYHAFMDSVDALVMGRGTLETVLGFPAWPFGEKRVIVMSRSLREAPAAVAARLELSRETPEQIAARLAGEGCRRIYLDGGRLIQSFLRAGLVTDLTLTRLPILLGGGRPLFGQLAADILLEHVSTTAYPFGMVQSVYRVRREG